MPNRTFLIQAPTRAPFRFDQTSPDVLAAASNCVPIYWYSLFDLSCIVVNTVGLSNGRSLNYPSFVSSTAEARARSSQRRRLLLRLTPSSHFGVLEGWFQFLHGIDRPFIHLQTAEFCMMDKGIEEHLKASVQAFDLPPSAGFNTHPAWSEMLDMAQIDTHDLAGTVAGDKLAGYQWNRPVPWNFKT